MKFAANWSLLALTIMVTTFTLLYFFRSPWWRNRIGKIYLVKSVVLSLVLLQITMAVIVSADYTYRQPIRLSIYVLGVLVYVPMIWSLVREQNADRRRRREACTEYRNRAKEETP